MYNLAGRSVQSGEFLNSTAPLSQNKTVTA
jgi:hypothetical protein